VPDLRLHGNRVDHARLFQTITTAVAKLSARSVVLDGEVAVFDEMLRSRFDLLSEPDPAVVTTPPVYIAFDVLYAAGRDVCGRPLRERRSLLEEVVAGSDLILPVRRLAANGLEAWAEVVRRQCEGYVAKDESSAYEGGPTRRWLKDRWRRMLFNMGS